MKATDIVKIQDTIDKLESQIDRLEAAWIEEKFQAELMYIRLANISQYSKSYTERFLAVHEKFPGLLVRLIKIL